MMVLKTRYLCFALGVCLLCACQERSSSTDISLETDEQKISYAIGYQFAQSLKTQNIKVDPDIIAVSIKDVLSDQKSRMTSNEMFTAIQGMRQQAMEEQKQQAEVNKKASQDFLNKNKSADGVVTTKSGLQYRVDVMGDGSKPEKDSVVRVHYKGTLITGEEFDSSHKRGRPIEFPVSGVIPGWTEALQLMPVGSKWTLFIPSDLAYGGQRQNKIPAHSTLIFEVELLDIVESGAEDNQKKGS